ncbi:MAG: anaerobic glycerol-3-phosphate dehydrogenase subunit A [Enterobacteriaceae bacterium]
MSTSASYDETDVIIIGGGATGAGIARDCARRGLRAILLERYDLATGATGRNHGLLHSGARYAVTDPESARECIAENQILQRIARHCIEPCGGLFISLPEDSLEYQSQFITACHQAGIDAQAIDPRQALHLEPSVNPALTGAVQVPDGTIDPFRLTVANVLDATELGARVLTYHEVIGMLSEGARITGVRVIDQRTKEIKELRAAIVVNAGGIWGQHIAAYAGVTVRMFPTRGALLILGHRLNNKVINRCRKPADADILVPGDTISLIGTTSTPITYEQIDDMRVSTDEVDLLLSEGEKLVPRMASSRILRAYAGARPLVSLDGDSTGRNLSRGIVLLDHAERDGLEGLLTIAGGKLITYRLMAEWTTDKICEKLGHQARCSTAEIELPGSRHSSQETLNKLYSLPTTLRGSAVYRHGDRAEQLLSSDCTDVTQVCECEAVSAGEVRYAVDHLMVNTLTDLRRRTRVGMGTCQGELCACRAAELLGRFKVIPQEKSIAELSHFIEERWHGIRPIAWGNALRESEFTSWVYQGICGLDHTRPESQNEEQIDEI